MVKNLPAMRDPGSIPGSGKSLLYSCLANSMDREAWWATDYGSHKEMDRTWVPNTFTFTFFLESILFLSMFCVLTLKLSVTPYSYIFMNWLLPPLGISDTIKKFFLTDLHLVDFLLTIALHLLHVICWCSWPPACSLVSHILLIPLMGTELWTY